MTDIVYLLGAGSLWNNNEMRYSLRSAEKHLSGIGKVFSVGHAPQWGKDIIHIECADTPGKNMKAVNIKNKILAAVDHADVSDPFLVFSDDYFLNRDYPADAYPYFHRGQTLEEGSKLLHKVDLYRRVYWNTIGALRAKNLPEKHFNVHAPILYQKAKVKEAFDIADWNTDFGMMSKSLYCNFHRIEGEVQMDCKLPPGSMPKEEIKKYIEGKPFFSISDRSLFRGRALWLPLVEVLNELYPNPSRWEK